MILSCVALVLICFLLGGAAAWTGAQVRTTERHIKGVAAALVSENAERREQATLLHARLEGIEDLLELDELAPRRKGDGLMVVSSLPGGRRGYRRPN